MHDVALTDDVFLAFEAHLACFSCAEFAIERDVIVVGDHLGADETFFEIRMDLPGRLRCERPRVRRPRARFLRTSSKERQEAEQPVGGADDAVEAGLLESEFGEKGGAIGLV